jgi:hypothetical protein
MTPRLSTLGRTKLNFADWEWHQSSDCDACKMAAGKGAEHWHGVERSSGAHRVTRQHYLTRILASLLVIPCTEQTAYENGLVGPPHQWYDIQG